MLTTQQMSVPILALFYIYNLILLSEKEGGVRMKISPIGTKLTILGSIMYIRDFIKT